ncbi:MAG: L-serine ammonia-lyase [Gammaproteobacteria bacterium]
MFISALELFKIGIGPSSSHTIGPMIAANDFINHVRQSTQQAQFKESIHIQCILKGSLAYTGKGHATDRAIALGLHGYTPDGVASYDIETLITDTWNKKSIAINTKKNIQFSAIDDIIFDKGAPLPEHPNGMIFNLITDTKETFLSETYFSIGGGFISKLSEINQLVAPLKMKNALNCPYAFDSASSMLEMSRDSGLSIPDMKRINELEYMSEDNLNAGLDRIWESMSKCIQKGLKSEGLLPGGLDIPRRAKDLYQQLEENNNTTTLNDWLCAYAMAVNEENAAGHMVVTAPTNGAAGVIPAVLYYFIHHQKGSQEQVREFLLTASAIGGIIKHKSSISGAEVGCQGEVGSASSMAAAGLCAVLGGSSQQIENAAEIALEHHLGMTCDPVNGLVQVPCIERNGFGAIKAYTAASLAMKGTGEHFMPLDNCIAAMKQTGLEMSEKYKETSLGGLAVSITEC